MPLTKQNKKNITEIVVWFYKHYIEAYVGSGWQCVPVPHVCLPLNVSLNVDTMLLPLGLCAVLTPSHLIHSTESELIGPSRCEPTD